MSDTDEGSGEQKAEGVDKIFAKLKNRWHCDTHGISCIVNGGAHVRLIPKDFAQWATMIVSWQSPKSHGTLTKRVGLAIW